MAAWKFEVSLQVLRNISRVREAKEWTIFQRSDKFVFLIGHVIFYLF